MVYSFFVLFCFVCFFGVVAFGLREAFSLFPLPDTHAAGFRNANDRLFFIVVV